MCITHLRGFDLCETFPWMKIHLFDLRIIAYCHRYPFVYIFTSDSAVNSFVVGPQEHVDITIYSLGCNTVQEGLG